MIQALMIRPVPLGWAVVLSGGGEVARFHGPAARRRALRHLEAMRGGDAGPGGPRGWLGP